jgi:hypothetical protein
MMSDTRPIGSPLWPATGRLSSRDRRNVILWSAAAAAVGGGVVVIVGLPCPDSNVLFSEAVIITVPAGPNHVPGG